MRGVEGIHALRDATHAQRARVAAPEYAIFFAMKSLASPEA
jgi:hypothetical protein